MFMSTPASFDPCRMWLGISALELSDPRRVLGLPAGPVDPVTVMAHAEQRLAHLRSVQAGGYEQARIALLARVEQARDAVLAQSTAGGQPVARPQAGFAMPPPPPGVARAATPQQRSTPDMGQPLAGHPAHAPYQPAPPAGHHAGSLQHPGSLPQDSAGFDPQPALPLRTRPRRRRRQSTGVDSLLLVLLVAGAGVAGVGGFLFLQGGAESLSGRGQNRDVAMAPPGRGEAEPEVQRPSGPNAAAAESAFAGSPQTESRGPIGPGPLDSIGDTGLRPPDRLPDPPPPGRGPPRREDRTAGPAAMQRPDPSPASTPPEPAPGQMAGPAVGGRPAADGMSAEPRPPRAPPASESVAMTGERGEATTGTPDENPASAGPVIDAAVEKAFKALVDSDFDAAAAALEPARKARKDRPEAERVDSWQLLVDYAKGFEGYRRQAVAAVKGGNEYDIPRSKGEGEMKVGIVDVADGKIVFRVEGQTLERPLEKLPANLLSAIVEDWFDDNPANGLYLGAYHLTRPEPDIRAAERLWSSAALRGADAAPLLPLLEEPVIRRAAAGE
jgi:hypothetical protein